MKKKPLTIMHLITELNVGGAEYMLYKIISHSNKEYFRHLVVSMTDTGPLGDKIKKGGIRVYELRMKPGLPNPMAILNLTRLLKVESVDILQTWLYHADLLGLIAGKISRVHKIAWGIRCSEMKLDEYKRLTYYTVRMCAVLSNFVDAIVVNSIAGKKVHEDFGYNKHKMVLIPNGFDTSLFQPALHIKESFKKELGLRDSDILIGMVARFDPMKDHRTFLKAAATLLPKDKRVHFVLVGKGMVPDNAELISEVPSVLTDRLHLLGQRDDIPRVMNGIDILTNASFGEGFSNVVGEAMSSGTICVVADVGDSANIVGDSGIVIKPSDPIELSDAWKTILNLEDNDLKKLRKKARNRIQALFDIHTIVTRFEEFYRELFKKKGSIFSKDEPIFINHNL